MSAAFAPVSEATPTDDFEIEQLLETIYRQYHYDFRRYSMASLRRRIVLAVQRMQCHGISGLRERITHDAMAFTQLLQYLTIPVSDMFRDPTYFRALREKVVPVLSTYPSVKVWVAGCSTGEEAYSLAILLKEEGLLQRSLIYATDINQESLRKAEAGIFELSRIRDFTENHRRSGGKGSLSEHYHAARDSAVFDASLKERIIFSDHSLATDSVFSEVQLISCRNVLIYFERDLQDRAIGLFNDSLSHRGFLGLGAKESLQFSAHASAFVTVQRDAKIYRRSA